MIISHNKVLRILALGSPWARAIALYPFVFIKKECVGNKIIINHEKIHLRQQLELLILPFYALYGLSYLRNRLFGMSHIVAYRNILFEKEARNKENDLSYLSSRKCFSFLKYI